MRSADDINRELEALLALYVEEGSLTLLACRIRWHWGALRLSARVAECEELTVGDCEMLWSIWPGYVERPCA